MKMVRGIRSGLVMLIVLLIVAIAVSAWQSGMFRTSNFNEVIQAQKSALRDSVAGAPDTIVIKTSGRVKSGSRKDNYPKVVPERNPLDEEIRQN